MICTHGDSGALRGFDNAVQPRVYITLAAAKLDCQLELGKGTSVKAGTRETMKVRGAYSSWFLEKRMTTELPLLAWNPG